VGADPVQHGLAAARQALPRELASPRGPAQRQAGVALGLAEPGGGVGIQAGDRRHPLGEGPPPTRGGITKEAPDMEVEAHGDSGPGQIRQSPAIAAMAAAGWLRTGGTGSGRGYHLDVQGQALVLKGEGLHLERRRQQASGEVGAQQQSPSCMSQNDTRRQQTQASIADCLASRTLAKSQAFCCPSVIDAGRCFQAA
jgi:hypothetical protein